MDDMTDEFSLWATTRYGPIKIKIYTAPRKEIQASGVTHWHHGVLTIILAETLLEQPIALDKTLIHEFVHVIEYLNDPGYLDPTIVEECTELARTVEVGMHQLLRNLKQVAPEKRRTKKKKKSTKKS